MAAIDVIKGWADTIRQDTDALKALLASATADPHARRIAGAALSYQVSKMDLIPDWNEGIGVLDDVMVLRVCAQLTSALPRGELPTAVEIALERMANEAERIGELLGGPLYDRLRAYCARLVDHVVRGRSPAQLVDDAAARAALFAELDGELARAVPIVLADPADAEVRLKAYLMHKLK